MTQTSSSPSISLVLFDRIELRAPNPDAERLLTQSKHVGLLALLAIPSLDRYVRRDLLISMLWPETDAERARSALRKALHLVRAALGADAVPSRGDEEVCLSSRHVTSDVAAFTVAADSGFLMQALQLYGRELMPGFHIGGCAEFDRWLEDARSAARERAAAAAWAMAQRFERESQFSNAAGMARRAMKYSWSDERALRRALSMLDRLGDRAGAVRLYDEFVRRLRVDLDLDPSEETRALAERIRSGVRIA